VFTEFVAYVGPPDLHDGTVLGVIDEARNYSRAHPSGRIYVTSYWSALSEAISRPESASMEVVSPKS
jgi:hypothetical protein